MEKHRTNTESAQSAPVEPTTTPRRRLLTFVSILLLLLIAAIVFFSPRILSSDTARSFVLRQLNKRIEGTLSVRFWDFAWREGIHLNGISFVSGDEELSFEAGGFLVEIPILDMARAARAIRRVERGEPVSVPLEGEIGLFHGLVIAGTNGARRTLVTNLNAKVKLERLDAPCSFMLSADSVPHGGGITGTGTVHLSHDGILDPNAIRGKASLKVREWNLAPIISAFFEMKGMEPPSISGVLGGAMKVNVEGLEAIKAEGELALWPSLVSGANGGVQAGFDTIDLSFLAERKGTDVEIERLSVSCDFLNAVASGGIVLSDSNTLSSADVDFNVSGDPAEAMRVLLLFAPIDVPSGVFKAGASSLAITGTVSTADASGGDIFDALQVKATCSVNGLDIGRIAMMAPASPLRPDIEGTAVSRIDASLKGREYLHARGGVEALGIRASGGFLGGDSPSMERINLDFDIARNGAEVLISSLDLRSSLVTAALSGSFQPSTERRIPDGSLAITGKLFAAEAARMFPVALKLKRDVSVSGGSVDLKASVTARQERAEFAAEFDITGLTALRNKHPVRLENDISATIKGAIDSNNFQIESLDVGSSFLSARASGNAEKASAVLSLDLANAFDEAAKFIDLDGKSLGGSLVLDASAAFPDSRALNFVAQAAWSNLLISGFTRSPISMKRAQIDMKTTADMDDTKRRLKAISSLSLNAETDIGCLCMNGKDLVPGAVPSARALDIRTELDFARLLPFISALTDIPDDVEITGNATASAQCAMADGMLKIGEFDVLLAPLSFRKGGKLAVENSVHAGGFATIPLRSPAGDNWRKTSANCVLLIESAHLMGMKLSDLKAPLQLTDGCMELDMETEINEGTLRLPLRVSAGADVPILNIPDGTQVLKDVRLTDEMVNELLAFISPLFRGCAVSTGTVGMNVNQCSFPLGKVDAGRAEFDSAVSFSNISLAPAGLLSNVLALVDLQDQKIAIPNQDVQTRYVNGRFHSSDLALQAGGYDIIISGSVGLDETLDYVVSLPVTGRLIGKEAGDVLKGRSIALPVTGVISKPSFDRNRFLKELAATAAEAATRRLIEQGASEADKLLEKGAKELLKWLGK